MKKIGFMTAFIFAHVAFAQSMISQVSLSMEGTYKKTRPLVVRNSTKKECTEINGRYSIKNKSCLIQEEVASVHIEKLTDTTYKIEVDNNAGQQSWTYLGIAEKINPVQLQSAEESDGCQVTVGFTTQNTLSVWTNNSCGQAKSALQINEAVRLVKK